MCQAGERGRRTDGEEPFRLGQTVRTLRNRQPADLSHLAWLNGS